MRTRTSHHTKLRTLGMGVALALAVPAIVPAQASAARCPGAYLNPTSGSAATIRGATLCLLNVERRQRGIGPLRHDARLATAATRHSRDMVRRRYFSHFSPGGSDMVDRIRRTRYTRSARSWSVGENIAWGAQHMGTPRSIVRIWMNSAPHRRNILNRRFREIGIGVAQGAPVRRPMPRAGTYTTNFGFRG